MTGHRQLPLLDASGYGVPTAGRVELVVEIIAELRCSLRDDELGATVRVRLADGRHALATGPDVPQRQVGATLHVNGYWDASGRRGLLLRIEDIKRLDRPHEARAVQQYLIANIPGLGRKRAARLVSQVGGDVLERLRGDVTSVRELFPGGSGEEIAMALTRWAAEQTRDTMAQRLTRQLTAAGVQYGTVRRIVRFFNSAEAAEVVTLRHPYRLVDVPGIGWQTADRIAARLGVAEDHPERYLAAVRLTLRDAQQQGHTGLPEAILRLRAARLLRCAKEAPEVVTATSRLISEGHAVAAGDIIGAPEALELEREVACRIAALLATPVTLSEPSERVVRAVLAASELSPDQRAAVWTSLRHRTTVITGRPGAGKTTTIKTLVACAKALDWRVRLVAPTGKAASRAAAVTGVSASTVHRLLAHEARHAPAPLQCDLLIVDETSMCDLETAAWLLRALPPAGGTRVVWCGDADQLPSVGSGQVLADLLASGVMPNARLTQVFRQAADSPIVRNAHRVLDHQPLTSQEEPGWRFVHAPDPGAGGAGAVLGEVKELIARGYEPSDVQVLAPMRRGVLGVEHLNSVLQRLLNPQGEVGPYIGGGVRARMGDRIVATRNIYDLPSPFFNGEQGSVVEADRRGVLRIRLDDRELTLTGIQCLMVNLAWAMTVHRSQGSEYPAVLLVYHDRAHAPMMDRRLLYTAITRARRHCSIVGTEAALLATTERASRSARHTSLAWYLASLAPPTSSNDQWDATQRGS